jgi:hypothetical protein
MAADLYSSWPRVITARAPSSQVRIGVQIHVGGVPEGVTGAFGEVHEGQLEVQRVPCSGHGVGLVGAVEADRAGAVGFAAAGAVVEAVATPAL